MPCHESVIGLPDYQIISTSGSNVVEIHARYIGRNACPYCESESLRKKDSFTRRYRHHCLGVNLSYLSIKTYKYRCQTCGKYFQQRLPGILPYQRATQCFREEVGIKHHLGHCKSKLAEVLRMSSSTVEKWYQAYLRTQEAETKHAWCPKVLGIDEKYFTKKKGYMTTFADLKRHKVFDLALGRSEQSLEGFLRRLPRKDNCRVVVMDLSEPFRSIARKHLPKAVIVADRFHVIKLVNHHFEKAWTMLDEQGRRNRGLVSLMRRHEWHLKDSEQRGRLRSYLSSVPGLEAVYDFKQELTKLLLSRVSTRSQARPLVFTLVSMLGKLRDTPLAPLRTLGETLTRWQEEIVRMWRFSKTNSITEGLHTRMEEILRRAYGMRNFENFRIRVKAFCG